MSRFKIAIRMKTYLGMREKAKVVGLVLPSNIDGDWIILKISLDSF